MVWVTGASSGIGEALAASLLKQGAYVIASGRRVPELERVAAAARAHAAKLRNHRVSFEQHDDDVARQISAITGNALRSAAPVPRGSRSTV